ncbi:MAG: Membrane-bound lytic murein transglycosylase precursor, partial [Pseudomonadota bacterium]
MKTNPVLGRLKFIALVGLALILTACANLEKPTEASSASTDTQVATAPTPTATPPKAMPRAPMAKPKMSDTAEPPADIWVRIRQGFAMPDLENDLVRDREEWYAARP